MLDEYCGYRIIRHGNCYEVFRPDGSSWTEDLTISLHSLILDIEADMEEDDIK